MTVFEIESLAFVQSHSRVALRRMVQHRSDFSAKEVGIELLAHGNMVEGTASVVDVLASVEPSLFAYCYVCREAFDVRANYLARLWAVFLDNAGQSNDTISRASHPHLLYNVETIEVELYLADVVADVRNYAEFARPARCYLSELAGI